MPILALLDTNLTEIPANVNANLKIVNKDTNGMTNYANVSLVDTNNVLKDNTGTSKVVDVSVKDRNVLEEPFGTLITVNVSTPDIET